MMFCQTMKMISTFDDVFILSRSLLNFDNGGVCVCGGGGGVSEKGLKMLIHPYKSLVKSHDPCYSKANKLNQNLCDGTVAPETQGSAIALSDWLTQVPGDISHQATSHATNFNQLQIALVSVAAVG